MRVPHIPVLRQGRVYESLDLRELRCVRSGGVVGTVGHANAGLVRRDLARLRAAPPVLRSIPTRELLALCARAGGYFLEGCLPVEGECAPQSPGDYVEALSATSGLPHALVRANMEKIHHVLTRMPAVLGGLTRGLDPLVLDEGYGEQGGVPLSFFPLAPALGVALPSNSPGVNSLWLPALALKIPVVLKPGRDDPWTPYRLIRALAAAGCPPEALSLYPTDHSGTEALIESCGRAILFGGDEVVGRYGGCPSVRVHGPGRSKILIGEDQVGRWEEYLELIVASIAGNGGRSCINASCVMVPGRGDEIADAVARRLAAIEPLPAAHPEARLAGFPDGGTAEAIDAAIERGLERGGAEEVTARYRVGPRRTQLEGCAFLRPTLVRCGREHPLADTEFMFPFASVVEVPHREMAEAIGPSLVVTAITADRELAGRLLASPLAERVNIGAFRTTDVRWDQPHEGNLFEFLYQRRAIQCAWPGTG